MQAKASQEKSRRAVRNTWVGLFRGINVHVVFLNDSPSCPDSASLEQVKLASESFALIGRCFYVHAPEGLARSKLAQRIERCRGVAGTGRNWRTVCKLSELMQASGSAAA